MRPKMVITKKGALLTAGLALVLVYFAIDAPKGILPFVVVNSIVLLIFIFDNRTIISPENLQIERQIDTTWQLKQHQVVIAITNNSYNSVTGAFRDTPPTGFGIAPLITISLAPGETIYRDYEVLPNQRGSHEFGPVYIEIISRDGLTAKRWLAVLPNKVDIIPDLEPLGRVRWLSRRQLMQNAEAKRRALGAGSDFVSVRQYVPGDEYRHINWWVTAKNNQLHTNNYDVEKNKTVWLILDAGRRMMVKTQGQPAFEHGISAVLALAGAAAEQGDQVGLLVVADEIIRAIPPQKGTQGIQAILGGLSESFTVRRETDFSLAVRYLGSHLRRRSLICVFSSLGEPQNGKLIASALMSLRRKHLTLFMSLEPQGALLWSKKQVNSTKEAFNKGASQVRREQSKKAGIELARSGIEVVRVPAGELALQGVLSYFQLRRKI
ncbi:MAG: DUF58 domain-containing protein [Peptococcaceae bacterium]|nr:DUF58 domain-containing protein [Peptococcaceae bacterium]